MSYVLCHMELFVLNITYMMFDRAVCQIETVMNTVREYFVHQMSDKSHIIDKTLTHLDKFF